MKLRSMAVAAGFGLLAAGCSSDGGLQTASINKPAEPVATVDPTCVALTNQIDTLRKQGSIEKLEQAAAGKSTSVKVKREALVQQAELNRVNAEFQTRCGPKLPQVASTVQVPAVQPVQSPQAPQ
ncbi:MAG: hypothetical protein KDJ17_09485 [Hyphomicrobiaceae bacterium]|nr:hypothetical protein [Hyphomicrobiaceae bacterium]